MLVLFQLNKNKEKLMYFIKNILNEIFIFWVFILKQYNHILRNYFD
jgi:hypothetical protein